MKTSGYYVYLHKKKTDGSVFYVGKGRVYRAWSKRRTLFWKNIVNKHGLVVEIVKDGLSEDEAFELEKKIICNLKETLINMTGGGEGKSGLPSSDYQKMMAKKARSKPVINSDGDIFESATVAAKVLRKRGIKANRASISLACTAGKNYMSLAWSYYSIGVKAPEYLDYQTKMKIIFGKKVKCNNGMVFQSLSDAVEWLRTICLIEKADKSNIHANMKGRIKSAYGYVWEPVD